MRPRKNNSTRNPVQRALGQTIRRQIMGDKRRKIQLKLVRKEVSEI